LLTRGILNVRFRKVPDAIRDLTEVIRLQVDNAEAHYYKGMAHLENQERLPAASELQEAVKYRPSYLTARLALAELDLESGAAQTALEVLGQTPRGQERDPAVILLKSACLIHDQKSAEAELMVGDLLKTRPNLGPVQTQYGLLLAEKKDYKGAQEAFEKALAVNKRDNRAIAALSLLFAVQNQAPAGEKFFQKKAADDPKYGPAVFGLEDMLLLQKKEPQAEKALKDYLAIQPTDAMAMNRLAKLLLMRGDYSAAENYFREALKIAPDNTNIVTSLGMTLEGEKRFPEAATLYREVLKKRADDVVASNNLAWLLSETGGNIDEALKWAQVSKEKAPNDAAVTDTLGWIYMKKNNSKLAMSEFSDAVNRAPKNPLYLYHLGLAQMHAGDTRGAQDSLQKALDQKVEFPGIDDARKSLKDIQNLKH
jgi:tetratricopeptide (TPR) repeat protein